MDALIEERVFGRCAHFPEMWTREEVIARERAEFLEEYGMEAPPAWTGDADSELSGDYPPFRCKKCGSDRVSSRPVYKKYSTDIAVAWLVVEHIRDSKDDELRIRFSHEVLGLNLIALRAPQVAEAICRAALAAAPSAPRETPT